ncbi:MAG TPA: PrgI family protein [Candidatus Paceibacterota bacterium]|nr:PrgI family protein [Candidatus Paceibacterota bacterium]
MQYQVPQFIEVEDKIFGPLTFKQFVYLVGGGAVCFLVYRFLPGIIAFLIIIPMACLSGALAFYKVNNKPFLDVIQSAVKYTISNKLYLWKKEPKKAEAQIIAPVASKVYVPKLSASKLRELTWSLDINENMQDAKNPVSSKQNDRLNIVI